MKLVSFFLFKEFIVQILKQAITAFSATSTISTINAREISKKI